jgi:UDP-N-acetylglucosamine--N-acetylmuramyl-(pentapeptide) pyrophosphoryl-undecaprenol N-acetylglucosamine transferase
LHRPKAFVFDGSYPYRGMLNSIKSNSSNMLKIWVKRGAIKKDSKKIPVDSIQHFDAVVRPGDSVTDDFKEETKNSIPIIKCAPIVLENRPDVESLSIRNRMGIPKGALVCYVQLGAGRINDIDSEIRTTIESLMSHEGVYAIIGESMLGERISFNHERVRVLRDYPNSQYFHEFDFAVIAGGYNTYHEVINAGLPALCYPNSNTGRDDQFSRAKVAAESGAMIVLRSRNRSSIGVAVSRIVDASVRNNMILELDKLKQDNGSEEIAKWIVSQVNT